MSKRIWQHPEIPATEQGTEVWRSIGELERTPQFRNWLEREFPEGAGELSDEEREMSRRSFVKLMGASSALAGLTLASCRRPESYIVPYKDGPEWVIPGKALYYATSMPRAGGAVPLVVTTHEGRPTKLEPNRKNPDGGGTDAFTQASVLDLYSPSRSRAILKGGEKSSAAAFVAAMGEMASGEAKCGFVFGEDDSPTRNRLVKELATAYPGAKFYTYEALTGEGRKVACAEAFGAEGATAVADFTKAKRILSLDSDFASLDAQGKVGGFFAGRQGGGGDYKHEVDAEKMNRLYVVETAYSMTGGMADHRMRATPGEIFRIAAEIARRVQVETGSPGLGKILADIPVLTFGQDEAGKAKSQWVYECAADLAAHKGEALVLAGSRHHEGLQRLVLAMNAALKSVGPDKPLVPVQTGLQGYGTIDALAADLEDGAVDTLFLMTPANPVYDTPADLDFAGLMSKAKTTVHFGLTTNATAWAADWHVPAAHYLESWGDTRTRHGVYAIVQPMILPLYGGVGELEFLAQLIAWKGMDWAAVKAGEADAPVLLAGEGPDGAASPAYDEVRLTFEGLAESGEAGWKKALKAGFLDAADKRYEKITTEFKLDFAKTSAAVEAATVTTAASTEALEINFAADGSVWDGRFIDNGWLQEAPDPIAKMSWDNAAMMSPKTAKELGLYEKITKLETSRALKPENDEGRDANAPMMLVKVGERELEVPVVVAFGHADNCITIPLGYGQGATDGRQGAPALDPEKPAVGLVGQNTGFNAYALRTKDSPLFATGATSAGTSADNYSMAFTQEHHAMYGRALAREISTQKVEGKGDFQAQLAGVSKQGMDSHAPDNIPIYKAQGSIWESDQDKVENLISDKIHQWGMTIDLNTCMGCNACMVACQAENNISIVGKEQVAMGREMHWIRMDRYFAAPKYDRDDHGHIALEEDEGGKKVNKIAPQWVRDNPEMIPQPVACLQCESAPCEVVCPVNATVHSEEGLNTMAYNRCIGTRYCANNCPYKARRFNYFDYNKRNPLIDKNLYKGPLGEKQVGTAAHLQRNPNVSVRMRGVMEKCTYCVQRLEGAKIKQKQVQRSKVLESGKGSVDTKITADDLRIAADRVRVACQDACPADAVRFGNLLHGEDSEMVRAKNSKRNYDLLNYIGTRPRTSYLARVKNPNPEMPDHKFAGQATIHMT